MRALYIGAIILGFLIGISGFVLYGAGISSASGKGGFYIPGVGIYILVFGGVALIGWGANGMRRAAHSKASKKVKIADEKVKVFSETDSHSPLVAELSEGDDVELGEVTEVNYADWIKVKLPDGKEGYVLGNVKTCTVLKAEIVKDTNVYEYPDMNAPPLAKLVAGDKVEIAESDWDSEYEQIVLVRVWLADGRKGFMPSNTKVKWV